MKILPVVMLGCAAGGLLAAPEFYEGFASPGSYPDGQKLVETVAPEGKPSIAWRVPEKATGQEPGAFVVRKPGVADKDGEADKDPTALREERARKREAEKAKYRGMLREDKQKKQELAEKIDKGEQIVARLRTTPGHLEMVPGQKSEQSIQANFSKPIEAPYYFSVLLTLDKELSAPFSIALEDTAGGTPVTLALRSTAEPRKFTLNTSGIDCREIEGPLLVIIGVEKAPKEREIWNLRMAVNPTDMSDPLAKGSLRTLVKLATQDPAALARMRITKGGKVQGIVDEIRVGSTIRDVLP